MGAQIIIVDDDPIVGGLSLELLKDAGYTVSLLHDSLKAQAIIKTEKPSLVVLDILMPGLDGLTLLHRLKSDPETAAIKAVVVSGKSFEAEKQRALSYGAVAFIEKPYDIDGFAKKVGEVIGAPAGTPAARPEAAPAEPPRAPVKAVVWGSRSASTPSSPQSARYGKRTSCVSVEAGPNLFVFDAGTGLALLGAELAKSAPRDVWLFLSHFHSDHVDGLAEFAPLKQSGWNIHIGGASDPDRPLEQALRDALKPGFGDDMPPAAIELYELIEQTYEILPNVRLSAFFANHPGTTLGFVLETEGRKIVYCPDSELYGESATALQDYDEKLGTLCRGADLLIHDARYTPEDYAAKRNGGHSSWASAVDFAGKNQVKELVLAHLDAEYPDAVLDIVAREAQARVEKAGWAVRVSVAREGLRLNVV